jgi:hypothetical protein
MRQTIFVVILVLAGVPGAHATGKVTVLLGKGAQVYACTPAAAGYAWQLKAPDAVLTDAAGHRFGRHFAGPTWQAEDGSAVVGEVLATSQAPQSEAIPWLVLRAKAHAGDGVFADVSTIVRSATKGGIAPAGGCDPAHAGVELRVDYSATYIFFAG